MRRKIIMSALINQVQIGLVEDGRLAEFYVERDTQERLVGTIYKGKIENVLPGMSAAFVNIGAGKNAFLHEDDIPLYIKGQSIGDKIRTNQSLIVQIAKEAIGSKGARVTGNVGLPGRFLVLLPFENHVGVSRQITDEEERVRLKEIATQIKPKKMGIIVRTVAKGISYESLQEDLQFLLNEWEDINTRAKKMPSPSLLYEDSLVHRVLRDLLTEAVQEIVVDSNALYQNVIDSLQTLHLTYQVPVQVYQGKVSLFDQYGLTKQLERAQNRRVWLDCGGYLVIDETEALISIDVNTGKYTGRKSLQETILETNLQAAEEVARQLRLRDLGGIIIVDFIDMDNESARLAVWECLDKALTTDKSKAKILGFTTLGLMEITRKKTRQRLSEVLLTECPTCSGNGRLESPSVAAFKIAQRVKGLALEQDVDAVLVKCDPEIASALIGPSATNLNELEQLTGKSIYVRGMEMAEWSDYELLSGKQTLIEEQAYPVKVGEQLVALIEQVHSHNKRNGIARVEGLVIDCHGAASKVGVKVLLEITELNKTYATAHLVDSK